jgi:hypothetical protein
MCASRVESRYMDMVDPCHARSWRVCPPSCLCVWLCNGLSSRLRSVRVVCVAALFARYKLAFVGGQLRNSPRREDGSSPSESVGRQAQRRTAPSASTRRLSSRSSCSMVVVL